MNEKKTHKEHDEHKHARLVQEFEAVTRRLEKRASGYRNSFFHRFPLVFIILSTFGLVATLYGFEKLIDQVPLLADNPFYILLAGMAALTLTGTLYKKL